MVLLPAPSGPINPKISPFSILNDTSLTATMEPLLYVLVMLVNVIALMPELKFYFPVHAYFNIPVVYYTHFNSVNQISAFVFGGNGFGSEFRLRGNPVHRTRVVSV